MAQQSPSNLRYTIYTKMKKFWSFREIQLWWPEVLCSFRLLPRNTLLFAELLSILWTGGVVTSEAQTKKSIADIGISAPSAKLI
jgi:hypothetical protein